MKKIDKKNLKKIKLEYSNSGFTIWIKEKDKDWYWLIDGSTFLKDGVIDLGGGNNNYKYEAVYDNKKNRIIIANK